MVITERLIIVNRITLVYCKISICTYRSFTIISLTAGKSARQFIGTSITRESVQVGIQNQTLDRSNLHIPLTLQNITITVAAVIFVITNSITCNSRTLEACLVGIIDNTSTFCLDTSICIANIQWIDRSYVVGDIEQVARTTIRIDIILWRLRIGVSETQTCSQFQPLLCLIVYCGAGSITLQLRVINDTTILQVTSTGKIIHLTIRACYISIVFLTE